MTNSLADYQEVVGAGVINELKVIADRVKRRRFQHINSTSVGGGVAEILTRLIPLLRELGIDATWDVIKGNQAFYNVTKAFHNALHGATEEITPQMLDIFQSNTAMNLAEVKLTGDVVMIHDPQPVGLVARKPEGDRRWVWRCHIDVSTPQADVWNFLRPYVEQYDAAVFSMPEFSQQLAIPQFRVPPSIDPLSDKNRPLAQVEIERVFEKYKIDTGRHLLTQISRFDRLKDPLGVIEAYRLVKKRHDCQLLLAGGGADDDPEGVQVLQEVREAAAADPDIHVLLLPPFSDLEINALVRGSTVVIQKSLREGFGLTVSEALWKNKPVVAGAVGGIRLQVLEGVTGFLVHSVEGAANQIAQLLRDRRLRERMGQNGHEHVKENFLLTRQVRDYILTILALEHPGENVVDLAA
jgi:trehalose synthase